MRATIGQHWQLKQQWQQSSAATVLTTLPPAIRFNKTNNVVVVFVFSVFVLLSVCITLLNNNGYDDDDDDDDDGGGALCIFSACLLGCSQGCDSLQFKLNFHCECLLCSAVFLNSVLKLYTVYFNPTNNSIN
ncbi:hypothetical protein GQX74_015459 [Glossina fuscipes]|nr:hypothetical protein GQX74_015459 [Glossina fuscipes]